MSDQQQQADGGQQQQNQQQQNQQKPWYDGIDAETIGHWDNKGWKKDDPKALVSEVTKAWKGLEKHFGAPADQILRLPKDQTDEAGWAAVRQRLGAPKEAKEYDFAGIKFGNGSDLDPAFSDNMRAALHKAGVGKDAAPEIVKAVVKWRDDQTTAESNERAARLQTERADLQREWGTNWEFNRLNAMQGAKRAAGSDENAAKLIEAMQSQIGYKATMEFWRKIGAGTNEDTFVDTANGGNPTTRNGAMARLTELKGDQAWAQRFLKGDVAAKREFDSLMALIHGAAA